MQRVQRPESRLEHLKIKIAVSDHIFTESEYILSNLNSAQLIQDVRCRLCYSCAMKLNLKSITILKKNV